MAITTTIRVHVHEHVQSIIVYTKHCCIRQSSHKEILFGIAANSIYDCTCTHVIIKVKLLEHVKLSLWMLFGTLKSIHDCSIRAQHTDV